ncbi:MAG: cell division protein SepF [Cyanobium sp.]
MAPALPLIPGCNPARQIPAPQIPGPQAPAAPGSAETHQILVLRPGCFEDGQRAIEAVRSGRSVVLNASDLDPALGQRLVDFTCGGITAMDGQSHRLGEAVFLFAPLMATIRADEPAL